MSQRVTVNITRVKSNKTAELRNTSGSCKAPYRSWKSDHSLRRCKLMPNCGEDVLPGNVEESFIKFLDADPRRLMTSKIQ